MWRILTRFFHQLASPPYFYKWSGMFVPWFAGLAVILIGVGVYGGLLMAPTDYQQGEAFRIIYVHVPSAYLSMMSYVMMAMAAAIGFIWRIKLAHAVAVSAAPIGASFTFLALITGAFWGKPMWGTFWQWGDARLVSELVLLFLFLGYMALHAAFEERDRADRMSAVLAVVGVVNVPIIHFSVEWWATLHQGPSITRNAISGDMLWPLLVMIVGYTFCFGWLLLVQVRSEVLEREANARWIQRALEGTA